MPETSHNQQSAVSAQPSAATLNERMNAFVREMVSRNLTLDEAESEFEKMFIVEVLTACGGNQCKAAREMRMHRNTLSRKIGELKIDVRRLCQEINGRRGPQFFPRRMSANARMAG